MGAALGVDVTDIGPHAGGASVPGRGGARGPGRRSTSDDATSSALAGGTLLRHGARGVAARGIFLRHGTGRVAVRGVG